MSSIGKRVMDELYVHISAIQYLPEPKDLHRVNEALAFLPKGHEPSPNVIKLNLRTGRLSLLAYADFEKVAFPILIASWAFPAGKLRNPTFRYYGNSPNPPILHRKELLVAHNHPNREHWQTVTRAAESIGLFANTTAIGFKSNWEKLIFEKGYQFLDGQFVPLGNAVEVGSESQTRDDVDVARHLTALSRNNMSAPTQLLLRHGLLSSDSTFFDYGCGRGSDISGLQAMGISATGWDPYFAPNNPIVEADVVNLGFVVNVIEDAAERVEAISRAFKLARKLMCVGVMLYGGESPGRPFRDGFITGRNTFQKYFTQGELKDYIEQVLQREVFMLGPGVAVVFADSSLEQRYQAERYRTRGVAARLLKVGYRGLRKAEGRESDNSSVTEHSRAARSDVLLQRNRSIFDRLWANTLELGRLPAPDEIDDLDEILLEIVSLKKAYRLMLAHYDSNLLAAAAKARTDDLCLLMSIRHFVRGAPYKQLEPRLQRDIKEFFGSYSNAQAAGLRLLFDAADNQILLEACQHAAANGLGWFVEGHSLHFHIELVDRLPVVLRAYVACGLQLWNSVSEVQIVKIHIRSGKLSLMEFDDFDGSAIPFLRRRIKINIRRQDCEVFEYGSKEHPKPLLYRKSRYLPDDYEGYEVQRAFDNDLDATGILGDSEFGLSNQEFRAQLDNRRLAISGFRLVRSERIPNLDEKCGANFSFRSFVECGVTQRKLAIENRPLSPETYNALYDLATMVLDPVIEYFGAINLTYGFCSAELARHIRKATAPRLDQHASFERNRAGRLICDRGGAACDFIVEYENMAEVADWIISNTPFDRLYFYGADRPIHVSYSEQGARAAFHMKVSKNGHLIPRQYKTQDTK